jgi:hypothetical protein
MSLTPLSEAAFRLSHAQREVEDAETALKKKKAELKDLAENVIPEMTDQDSLTLPDGSTLIIGEEFYLNPAEKRRAETAEWLRAIGATKALTTRIVIDVPKGLDETAQALEAAVSEAVARQRVALLEARETFRRQMTVIDEDLVRAFHDAKRRAEVAAEECAAQLRQIGPAMTTFVNAIAEDASLNEDAVKIDTGINGSTLRALLLDRFRKGHDVPEDIFGAYVARSARVVPKPQTDPVPL